MASRALIDKPIRRRPRPLAVSAGLIAITIAAGLTVRFVHLGLPFLVVKFGGSALWAVAIYFLSSTIFGRWPIRWNVALSGIIGTAVEFLKLYQEPWLDAFRTTLPGIVILGRIFNWRDIAVYWGAIMIAAGLDYWLRGWIGLRSR